MEEHTTLSDSNLDGAGWALTIVSGSGHRQTQIVKDYHSLEKMLLKTLQYEEIEAICGTERNSYYKTDKDATAMCLKTDYYSGLGSNMHAAYSLQIVVSKGLILDYLVSQDRSDSKTFIPLLDNYHADYGSFSEKLWQTADMVHWITAGIWLLRA